MTRKNNRGQSTLEYAILIIVIIAALLSLQMYVKRGVQGRLKSATDDVGDQFGTGSDYYKKTVSVSNTFSNNTGGNAYSGKRADGVMTTNVTTSMNMATNGGEYMP